MTTTPGPGLQRRGLRLVPPAGQQAGHDRADALVEVGDAGEVGQHVVAVEAEQRRELPDHLQHLGGDDQQDGVPAGEPPDAEGRQHHEGVEVEPAEVGAHPPAAAEAVAVGDVGVEGRPEQVDAEAHGARGGAAVARRGGVPELVEAGGQHRDHRRRPGTAPGWRTPAPSRPRAPGRRAPSRRPRRRPARPGRRAAGVKRTAKGAVSRRVTAGSVTTPAEPEREQRVGPAQLGLAAVGPPQQAQRPQRARPPGAGRRRAGPAGRTRR